MLKNRLIPVLFLMNGYLVRSEDFGYHQKLGYPHTQVERYNAWDVDELIYIDITRQGGHDIGRDDIKLCDNRPDIEGIIELVASRSFMPLTFGGGIHCLEDIRRRIALGADKVTINRQALAEPGFVGQAAREFGSQAIIVCMDCRREPDGGHLVYADFGSRPTGRDPVDWARQVEDLGAGEIMLNSVDRDGQAEGYDLELIAKVAAATSLPVIACGGVGRYGDFAQGLAAGAHAVAAGNIFHFREQSYLLAKQALKRAGANVR